MGFQGHNIPDTVNAAGSSLLPPGDETREQQTSEDPDANSTLPCEAKGISNRKKAAAKADTRLSQETQAADVLGVQDQGQGPGSVPGTPYCSC